VQRCSRHESDRYPRWSTFRWGSPVEVRDDTHVYVEHHGEWVDSEETGATSRKIRDYHRTLYGEPTIPDEWVFNDFGHISCFYYRDDNANGRQDKGERRRPDFIHPTPEGEALERRSKPVELGESHGCIHVRPRDLDQMIERGYLAPGNVLHVHLYDAYNPYRRVDSKGKAPFEVHFDPGDKKLCVLGSPQA
jgi:hypothetical protein